MSLENEENTQESVLSFAQRRARGMRLRRMQKRIQRARALQMKRTADPKRLLQRATKSAYKMFRARLSGGKDYATLGASEKIGLDKRLQKLLPVIKKFATRLIPQVRRKEQQRRKSMMAHQNEAFTDFMLERKMVDQDPDVKDKPGTQPKVYFKGLDKETKEKRDAHFKKMGPRPDDDKSAYVDAPGDKEAREKGLQQSKHTKKYKQMFGEELDKKDMQRLDMLVRMGLADKKYISLIKRSIGKLDSGETMSPQERQASFNLLQTLLDMTLSTDAIFRMTRSQVQKGKMAEEMDLGELSYKGNVGIMEFTKFFQKASDSQIAEMKKLLTQKKTADALKLLHVVTGTKLQEDLGIAKALSPVTHFASYSKAKKTLKDLMARKKDSTKSLGYYASEIAKQYPGVDVRKLMAMMKEDYDWEERDGLEMAQIEVANMAQDVEELAELLDMMDEEPEAWVLSKITKAADYIESVKNYLEFEDDFDDDNEDDDEDEMDDIDFETEFFNMMREDGIMEGVQDIFEEIEGLKKKSEKSGISYGILKKVYDRGMAAWQSGHRPGTTPQQWAFARVNSFITKGKGTWGGADSDLASKVKKNEEFVKEFSEAQEIGTDAMRIAYARMTPGQNIDLVTAKYETDKVLNVLNDIRTQRAKKLFDEQKDVVTEAIQMHIEKKIPFTENVFRFGSENYFEFFRRARELHESNLIELSDENLKLIEETDLGKFAEYEGKMVPLDCPMCEEELNEAEYQGKDVKLNDPFRTPGGPRKFAVYTMGPNGKVVIVRFGDPNMEIKRDDPARRASFRARHGCDDPGPKYKAKYWSCYQWRAGAKVDS